LGEPRKAIELHEKHRAIAREIEDRRGEGNALCNLGLAYVALGETHKAIEFYEQALAIAREIGNRRDEGTGLWCLALAHEKLGRKADAVKSAESALAIYEAIEAPDAAEVQAKLAEWRGGEAK
jgi:tetratricopeptide (TPR) repeat protein